MPTSLLSWEKLSTYLSPSLLVSCRGSPPEVSIRNTWEIPATGEENATVCPSGESLAVFIGLFHWLICVIFARPFRVLERDQKRYNTKATAKSATQVTKTIDFARSLTFAATD